MREFLFDRKNRNFLKLWLAQLISQFGDRIHQLALVGLAAERASGSATDLAKLLAFTIIPVFIVQPFAGVLVDRWDKRITLFVCDCARATLVLLIPAIFIRWEMILPIYGIVFFSFCFSRFYIPAKMSIIPDLVEEDNLLKANSLVSTTGMIAFVLGCAVGGFLIDRYGAKVGFMLDAATFIVSAILLVSMDTQKRLTFDREKIEEAKEIMRTVPKSVWAELKEGFRYIWEHKELRFVINTFFLLLASSGAVYIVIIVFIQNAFDSITKDLGILAVCLGIGLFLGALLYGRFGKNTSWYKTIFCCLLYSGLMMVVFAVVIQHYAGLVVAMLLSAMLGLTIGPIFIAANTITHVLSNQEMRGKVFSALEIVIHFSFLVSMLISSWISKFVPEVWILCVVGVIVSVCGLIGLFRGEKFAISRGNVA